MSADSAEEDSNSNNGRPPLWKYISVVDKIGGGGNVRFTCNYCSKSYTGYYVRVKNHLLKIGGSGIAKCGRVSSNDLVMMQRQQGDFETRAAKVLPKQVPLPPSNSRTNSFSSSASTGTSMGTRLQGRDTLPLKRKKVTGDSPLEMAFNVQARQDLDSEIARMFYSSGLAFSVAKNPYYIRSYTRAANSKHLAGYVPPGYNALRTTLLQKERRHIEGLLEPLKTAWKGKGVSIVSDGWTDAQRRPLINFMAASEGGPMFLQTVNCEGEYKDKHFICNLLKEVILSVGPQNVVQVITDNAPVCRSAGLLIENQFPHIFWTPCVVHTLNLALRNICAAKNTQSNAETYEECSWITDVIGDVMAIKNFIVNHSMRLSMFNSNSQLKLLSVAETRFASSIIMLKRFKLIKQGLLNMVVSPNWANYREDDVRKASFVKEKILNDLWWDKIDYILDFTEPIYEMLRKADTDKPCLHLVYDWWDSMIENVKGVIYRHEGKEQDDVSPFYSIVHNILVDRWAKSNTPLHCLAHSLNPRYYSDEWLKDSPNRVPPHKDKEISDERLKCFKEYFPSELERKEISTEFAKFSGAVREFGCNDSISNRGSFDPDSWWITYGSSTPLLQNLALKLLGQPCSSTCCERNWSTYSFINSLLRNKITPQRGEDLVFVHSNLRLLSRQSPEYIKGESSMWDLGADGFDTLDDVGILGMADLSLDEQEIEAVLFTTDDTVDVDDEDC